MPRHIDFATMMSLDGAQSNEAKSAKGLRERPLTSPQEVYVTRLSFLSTGKMRVTGQSGPALSSNKPSSDLERRAGWEREFQ